MSNAPGNIGPCGLALSRKKLGDVVKREDKAKRHLPGFGEHPHEVRLSRLDATR